MRIGPIGALYRDHPAQLSQCAWESSLITHGTLLAGNVFPLLPFIPAIHQPLLSCLHIFIDYNPYYIIIIIVDMNRGFELCCSVLCTAVGKRRICGED